MNYQEAQKLLASLGESYLLSAWDTLSCEQQTRLLNEIESININTLTKQKKLLREPPQIASSHFQPFTNYFVSGNIEDREYGKTLIAEGRTGCILVAGGQGTRLRFDGPKGMFPITPLLQKSLFQVFAEKVSAAGSQAGRPLSLAIMTSPQNHTQTVNFFQQHDYFGLSKEQLCFFPQGELPFLDQEGHLFLESPSDIAEGPDGNGFALHHFYNIGPGKKWEAAGIKYINFIVVDNPLADPFDAELIGHHARLRNAATVKCTLRRDPEEKVGVLGYTEGQLSVIEYSELPETLRQARNGDGTLQYGCANLSLFCFSMNFIKEIAEKGGSNMPLHKAFKPAKHHEGTINAWKFENFIFDVLPIASKVSALLYPRERCFAPLKNYTGTDSPETVSKALETNDRQVIEAITGEKTPEGTIELDQRFHYPTPQLLQKWKGHQIPSGFITI